MLDDGGETVPVGAEEDMSLLENTLSLDDPTAVIYTHN
jgi:hypothetical protein